MATVPAAFVAVPLTIPAAELTRFATLVLALAPFRDLLAPVLALELRVLDALEPPDFALALLDFGLAREVLAFAPLLLALDAPLLGLEPPDFALDPLDELRAFDPEPLDDA